MIKNLKTLRQTYLLPQTFKWNNDGDNEYKNTEWEPYKDFLKMMRLVMDKMAKTGFDLQVDYVRP